MAFSQEVRFKIGGDTSGLKASFSQATSMAEATGKQMEKSLSRLDKITSQRGLLEFRRKVAFEEANTVGKIKITTEKLASLSYQISQSEAGTTRQRKLQLEMAKEQAKLSILRRQQQADNLAGPAGAATGGEAAATGGGLFGGVNVRQLAFRAVGGLVVGALSAVREYMDMRTRVTDAQAEGSWRAGDALRGRFAATGGLTGELRQGEARAKDLDRLRKFYESRRDELSTPAQLAVMGASAVLPGGAGFKPLEDAERSLVDINALIAEQHNKNKLIERDIERQRVEREAILTREYHFTRGSGMTADGRRDVGGVVLGREIGALPSMERAQAAGQLNNLTTARIELERLQRVDADMRRQNPLTGERLGTPEELARSTIAIRQQQMAVRGAGMSMAQLGADVRQQLAGDAAEGRTFANGRPRPLSETERLARRAQQFRERARAQILTGGGADAGRFMAQAITDEASVGNRLAAASAGVAPKNVADATALKPEIARSNQLLTAISKSLENVDVD